MLKLLEQSLKRRKTRNHEFKTIKRFSNISNSLFYIPGFLFDVPDLLVLPKFCKEKIYFLKSFSNNPNIKVQKLLRIRDF